MLRKLFFVPIFFSFTTLSAHTELPYIIDTKKPQPFIHRYLPLVNPAAYIVGKTGFWHSTELTPFFVLLREEYHIEAAVETGTWYGDTTSTLATLFNQVHTTEISEELYLLAVKRLKPLANVHCHLGSSEQLLNKILPSLSEKTVLFYLDAHWNTYWPLLDELQEISKTHKDNCVIVIDDIKVPGRPDVPYDTYGTVECAYEYIEEKLKMIFTDYTVHYLIPKNVECRAKLIVLPKSC